MGQRGNGRYDRSKYGSGDEGRGSSGRYHDSFFDDMLIPDEEPARSFSSRLGADAPSNRARRARPYREDDSERHEVPVGDNGYDDSGRVHPQQRYRTRMPAEPLETHESHEEFNEDGLQQKPHAQVGFESPGEEPAAEEDADRMARAYSRKAVEEKVAASALEKRAAPRFRVGRVGRVVAVVLLAVVLVGAGVAFAFFSGVADRMHAGVDDDLRAALVETDMAKEPFYMLLLGTDGSAERDEDPEYAGGYRSDSMMLARIDPVEKKATLVSIGRDLLVDLGPEDGKQKINAAYAIGGPALAVKAVSQLAGVPISHYAQVDFDGFAAMVDALGGVEVDVPMAIVDDFDAGGSVPGGLQTLDGAQALILCRARNSYADISAHPDEMRAANQRLVLSAIARKLLSSDIATIASTVQAMSAYVTTDLELTDIVGLAQVMKGLDPDTAIYTASVPSTSQYVDDIWYEMLNKDSWDEMMKRVKAGEPPVEEAIVDEATGTVLATAGAGTTNSADKYAVVTVKNATDIPGLATKLRAKLVENGFVNTVVGDIAPGYSYPETLVVYDEENRAREAAEILGVMGQGRAMKNDGSYLLMDTDFVVVIGEDWDETA